MSTFTNALSKASEDKIINWLNGTDFPTAPTSLEVALYAADPGDVIDPNVEISGGSYARQAITLAPPQTSETDGSVTENTNQIVFSGMPAVIVTHWAIHAVGGDPIVYGPLASPIATGSGGTITFAENTFRLEMGGLTSKWFGEAFINWVRGTAFPAAPASVEVGLSTQDPKRDGSGLAEPPGGSGYSRQQITFGSPSGAGGGGQILKSLNGIIFGPSQGTAWGNITHGVLFDSNGNQIAQGALSSPIYVGAGEGLGISATGYEMVIA